MSLQSKIAVLKQKADKYDKIQNDYVLLEDNYKKSCQFLYNLINEKNNIITDLNTKIVDKNNEYTNYFTTQYNLYFTNEYTKLQNIIDEQKKQIKELYCSVSYYSNYFLKLNNNTNTNDVNNYIYREQILNTKIDNLLKELTETEKEKEYLLDKVSFLTGHNDDLKGCSEIKQKKNEIDLLQKEVNKLEDYILHKDRIISNLMNSSPNQNIISFLKSNLQQKNIENIALKKENEKYKQIIEELEGIDIGIDDCECIDINQESNQKKNNVDTIKIEEYEHRTDYISDEEEDEEEDEDDEDEEDEEDDDEDDVECKYNLFNQWIKINKPKEDVIKFLSIYQNLD
jgi:hypothetical protein